MVQARKDKQLSISEQLIEVCSAPIQTETRRRAAVHVLDWLGCIFSGAVTAPGTGIRKFSQCGQFGPGRSFVCGQQSLNASGAAFINGGLGNILEMDDVHRASILHAGDIIIPAVLATAQEQQVSLSQMLDSIVRGYEIALRLGVVAASGGYSNWYNSGTCGVFGAAFGSAHVLGLGKDQLKDCLGQAGMLGSGIWQCRLEPTWSKQVASANAASNGVIAATLAQQQFPGARFIFEGEAGFFATYYPQANVGELNLDPVGSWLLNEVSFKPWPACRHNHPAIEAALKLQEEITAEELVDVEIKTYQAAIDFCDNPNPETDHDARFSLQHCVAVALLKGEPTINDFEKSSREHGVLSSLRQKIRLSVGQTYDSRFPKHMGSAIKVTLQNGESIEVAVDNARGDPENPMAFDEIKQKYLMLVASAGVTVENATGLFDTLIDGAGEQQGYSLSYLDDALAATVNDMQKHNI